MRAALWMLLCFVPFAAFTARAEEEPTVAPTVIVPPQAVLSPWWFYDVFVVDPERRAGVDQRLRSRRERALAKGELSKSERFYALIEVGDGWVRAARRGEGGLVEAMAAYDEAILLGSRQLLPGEADAVAALRLRRGLVGWEAQAWESAETDLSMLIAGEVRAETGFAMIGLAEIAWRQGDLAQAAILWELVAQTGGPFSGLGWYRLSGIEEAKGDLSLARSHLLTSHELLRRSFWLHAPLIANHAREQDAVRLAVRLGPEGPALIQAICAQSGAGCAPRLLKRLAP